MTADRVNLGLIGAGRIGRLHARHLLQRIPTARLVMIAESGEEAARACAGITGSVPIVEDYRRVLDHPEIEAVLICSSTDTHATFIQEAAAAGKDIFCEKPIALDLAEIDRALAAVDRSSVKLQVGFNRRFDHNYRRVREAVTRGEIGEPHLLHIVSRDPAPPPLSYLRVSGGLFLDMTIHDFDMARFLIGSEVQEIYTAAAVRVDPAIGQSGDVDTAVVTLKFDNGVIGTIDNSRQAVYGYDQRLELFGSEGSILIDNDYPNSARLHLSARVQQDLPLHFFLERYTESYIREIEAFIDAVQQGTTPPVTGYDGRVPVVMGFAARRSYEENRPVRLDEFQQP